MIVKLNDVIARITGNVDRNNTDLLYYVGGEHYDSAELVIPRMGLLNSDEGRKLGFKFHFPFQKGDVLFMARNPHLRKAAMATENGICSDASYILRTKDEKVLRQAYIPILVQQDAFWDYFEANKTGSVNFLMNWKDLKEYEFKLPSIEEQDILCKKVWAAYRLKQEYKKLLASTDELVKSQFIEMLNSNGYSEIPLGQLCKKITDGSHNPPKGIDISEYIMISSKNVYKDGLDLSDVRYLSKEEFEIEDKRTRCSKGDVLLTIVGTIGRAYLIRGDEGNIVMQRSVAVLSPNEKIMPQFLTYSLHIDEELEKEGRGNAQKGVYLKELAKYKIKVPSITIQRGFEAILIQADKSKFELNQSIQDIDKIIRTIIQ